MNSENSHLQKPNSETAPKLEETMKKVVADPTSLTDGELLGVILSFLPSNSVLKDEGNVRSVISNGCVLYSAIGATKETDETTSFFKTLKRVSELLDAPNIPNMAWEDYEAVGNFFYEYIGHDPTEVLCLVFLDKNNVLIKIEKITVGRADAVAVMTGRIIKSAAECNAKRIFIAHNHPSGFLGFSTEDWKATKKLLEVFSVMGVALCEHYTVSPEGYKALLSRYDPELSIFEEAIEKSRRKRRK